MARPSGTNNVISDDMVARPFGTNRSDDTHQTAPTDVTSITIDAKELDIPYDMIIGRNSIIEYSLLLYDPDHHALGMRIHHDDDSSHDIAHNSAVGRVLPTVRGDTNDGENQGAVAKQPDGTFVGYLHEVHRLFMLLEGEKTRHYMCPAEVTEKLLTLSSGIAMPTAKLKDPEGTQEWNIGGAGGPGW